jgi:hypothetical protein
MGYAQAFWQYKRRLPTLQRAIWCVIKTNPILKHCICIKLLNVGCGDSQLRFVLILSL